MDQNSVISLGLIIGFVVFITIKGQLSSYLSVIGLSRSANLSGCTPAPQSSTSPSSTSASTSATTSNPGGVLQPPYDVTFNLPEPPIVNPPVDLPPTQVTSTIDFPPDPAPDPGLDPTDPGGM